MIALAAYAVFLGPAIATAFAFVWDGEDLPAPLAAVLKTLPQIFPAHMALGACALASAPLAFLARKRRSLHKILGSIAILAICGASLTSFPVSIASKANGMAKLGFLTQATLWLLCAVFGVAAMRLGRLRQQPKILAAHKYLMIVVLILTLSPVLLRLMTGLALSYDIRSFRILYGWIAWMSWLAPLSAYFGFLGARKFWRRRGATVFIGA